MCDIVEFSGGVVVEEVTEGIGVTFGWIGKNSCHIYSPHKSHSTPTPSHALYSYQISHTTNEEKNQDCEKSRAAVFVEIDRELRIFT